MKVQASTVTLAGSHRSATREERRESLRAWVGPARPQFDGDRLEISSRGRALAEKMNSRPFRDNAVPAPDATKGEAVYGPSERDKHLIDLLERMLTALTGKVVKLNTSESLRVKEPQSLDVPPPQSDSHQPARPQGRQGWGFEYDSEVTRTETEVAKFEASGTVRTADGRDIAFSLNLTMARAFTSTERTQIRAGDAKPTDPLVLNFAGAATELSGQTVEFDLNVDGANEVMPFVAQGNGILVFDRNGDGVVNDGSELFGPTSGDGFAELARLDADGNGWIDESDPLFGRLGVWMAAGDGQPRLVSLGAMNVGAIYVGHADTPFQIRGVTSDEVLAQVRASGVYLSEQGSAGAVQQIDLATRPSVPTGSEAPTETIGAEDGPVTGPTKAI